MSNKKVNISFVCDKWASTSKVDDENRYCSSCDKIIHDFSKSKQAISNDIYCGHFDLSQVNSINNSFSFSRTGVYTISLIAALGVSFSQNQIVAQNIDSDKEVKEENLRGLIQITGEVRDRMTNKALSKVNVLLESKGTLLLRTQTDSLGFFYFEIEVSEEELNTIDVKFADFEHIQKEIKFSELVSGSKTSEIEVFLESVFKVTHYKNNSNVFFTGKLNSRNFELDEEKK